MLLTLDNTQDMVKDVMTKVHQAVVATMGPNGKLALIGTGTSVKVTKDGVTVAKSIKFDDPRDEVINRVIVEAAIKTDHECGDGTTTTVMLTAELYSVLSQFKSFREQRFIEQVIGEIGKKLRSLAIQVTPEDDRLFKLALTSSNSDHELSTIITDIYKQSGDRYPAIELKEGQSSEDKVVHSNGLPLNMSFSNPGFSKYGNGADTLLENFIPVVIDGTLGRGADLTDELIKLHDQFKGQTDHILIIARSIEHEVGAVMANINNQVKSSARMGGMVNTFLGGPTFVGINTNAGGSVGSLIMGDIATIFGVPMFTQLQDAVGAEFNVPNMHVTVGNSRSLVSELDANALVRVQQRADAIEQELSGYEMGDRFSVRAKFNESRIRNLRGQLVTIFVGGETYSDVKERLDRFEDVVKAVKSALDNGILPGAGTSLMKAGLLVLSDLYDHCHHQDHVVLAPKNKESLYPVTFARDKTDAKILERLAELVCVPYVHLAKQSDEGAYIPDLPELLKKYAGNVPDITNLATGETGQAQDLGVYDTAFALVTALKGGLQTAKILANASSLLLGDKLHAVKTH
jgi:chaperonin GroEL